MVLTQKLCNSLWAFLPPSTLLVLLWIRGLGKLELREEWQWKEKKRKNGLDCKRKAGSIASDLGGKCLGFKEHEIL